MGTILRAKKGKSNLSATNDLYNNDYHNQKEMITESIPKIVPLYDGTELKINQKLIMNGLATISVRNMRSKGHAIKKRNSFFNLHRPELKGLDIIPNENQQEKTLHQQILKEVKTIHAIKTMKSLCTINGPQSLLENNQANISNDNLQPAATLVENHFQKRLIKPIAISPSNQQIKWDNITELEESTLKADKFCVHDVEIKSTLID
ncbi:uncharacterized protein LOC114132881 isoform X2 [Aphis gossypii]|uniref:uncharacterized protein LOC114132881 isoform X2 n=1 Tax=Aphis gossypii TaxID=80765 RepID=UPI00100E32AA|nr:uncharacterized protein LOC114132881 isoform X2 [Aphis gossypii]